MTTIMPEGESIRNAVKWISEKRKENPDSKIRECVNEASSRFNLSPKEQEYLLLFCKNEK
jgi:hypothetical protein